MNKVWILKGYYDDDCFSILGIYKTSALAEVGREEVKRTKAYYTAFTVGEHEVVSGE